MRNHVYSTELSQGTGMINETLALLPLYQESMKWEDLYYAIKLNPVIPYSTEIRLHHIINKVFYKRFMKTNKLIPVWLRMIRNKGLSLNDFSQLLMVYCAREHAVFFEAITEVLNPIKEERKLSLPREALLDFMRKLVDEGKASWTENLQKKNAGYTKSTMVDFNLIDRKGCILPYEVSDFTVLYLLYEAHFAGVSDMGIWEMEEWRLFNLNRPQVLDRIMSLSLRGAIMTQTSGELLNISWTYKSMEDFINGTL